jgi:transposase
MMVSQDGGVPFIGKALNGNASDNEVFRERSEQLLESFKASTTPRYLIADCKLYTEKNAVNLRQLNFVTRIPHAIKLVSTTIDEALNDQNDWKILDDSRKVKTFEIDHYDIKQRWLVISSETSKQRAIKQVNKKVNREDAAIVKQLFHFQAERFNCAEDAMSAIKKAEKKWKFHELKDIETIEHFKYEGKGRPKKGQEPISCTYQIIATYEQNEAKIKKAKEKAAHYIIGTNIDSKELSDQEIVDAYKNQDKVERGFRFLKDPLFFTSSLFLKNPKRIMALLMIMLLSLLVYSIAERRMRMNLEAKKETLPNQIRQETKTPTLRWAFQLLYGINHFQISVENKTKHIVEGVTELQEKVIRLFEATVASIYQITCDG